MQNYLYKESYYEGAGSTVIRRSDGYQYRIREMDYRNRRAFCVGDNPDPIIDFEGYISFDDLRLLPYPRPFDSFWY